MVHVTLPQGNSESEEALIPDRSQPTSSQPQSADIAGWKFSAGSDSDVATNPGHGKYGIALWKVLFLVVCEGILLCACFFYVVFFAPDKLGLRATRLQPLSGDRSLDALRPGNFATSFTFNEAKPWDKGNVSFPEAHRSKRWYQRHPYEAFAGVPGHTEPDMYGRVQEKSVWVYWHDPVTCPSASNCTLPAALQLCVESVKHNIGNFDFHLLHIDDVLKYVTALELPAKWRALLPAQQKDALMNALLARYGGVAWDISMVLLRPLDSLWDEMVKQGASFRGYMYRLNGQPWRHEEVMAVWFMMSRREGILSAAVRSQVIGMGDENSTGGYLEWYRALGDHTITPVLSMVNYSFPKCFDDETVKNRAACPEFEQHMWSKGNSGPPRNDVKLILQDPRDGPELPMAWIGMETFNITDSRDRSSDSAWNDMGPGAPMHTESCFSPRECWRKVVMSRFRAGTLPFVKMFGHGSKLGQQNRADLLAAPDTYFVQWLRLAGVVPLTAA